MWDYASEECNILHIHSQRYLFIFTETLFFVLCSSDLQGKHFFEFKNKSNFPCKMFYHNRTLWHKSWGHFLKIWHETNIFSKRMWKLNAFQKWILRHPHTKSFYHGFKIYLDLDISMHESTLLILMCAGLSI